MALVPRITSSPIYVENYKNYSIVENSEQQICIFHKECSFKELEIDLPEYDVVVLNEITTETISIKARNILLTNNVISGPVKIYTQESFYSLDSLIWACGGLKVCSKGDISLYGGHITTLNTIELSIFQKYTNPDRIKKTLLNHSTNFPSSALNQLFALTASPPQPLLPMKNKNSEESEERVIEID